MKLARKLPRRVFFSPIEGAIRRARMRAYLDRTREAFQRNINIRSDSAQKSLQAALHIRESCGGI